MRRVRGSGAGLFGLLFVAAYIIALIPVQQVDAAQITTRSLTLLANGTTGGSTPGGVVNHQFAFTLPAGTLGSIKFEYCTIAVQEACVAPTDINVSAATFGGESGATGFSMGAKTANSAIIQRASASAASGAVTYTLNSVTNPSPTNYTFFVRISTYSSLDGSGAATHTGTVAASTATPIQLSGVMPESLIFCAAGTINLTGGIPDCSTAGSGTIAFNQLFSPTDTATATSQMVASTNALNGYAITVTGPTLTNASATIPAMVNAAGPGITPTRGTSQFGMNLAENTTATSTVAVGGPMAPLSSTDPTNLTGSINANYATPDEFKYFSGDTVASSSGPTNSQRYTVSYIANVAGNQLAGTYVTTLTYVCTPTF